MLGCVSHVCITVDQTQTSAGAETDKVSRARLLAGRALALEGESDFKNALVDYQKAEDLAVEAGYAALLYSAC
jgi:hypothetical protein